ncbi:S-layer family protein [Anaerobacterium chartisolvens]|uniref:S-layer family protein n=1 Tax=Anaerobacterium chartisolvens TaxID=1297424 RepID=A0A369ATH8_9FIRM|nr:S-layer homology domain-containing protein [Anaerobacterium chartisolvens]RCX12531.1 S-layer family protein [Anaerobacterium chartisolvens]
MEKNKRAYILILILLLIYADGFYCMRAASEGLGACYGSEEITRIEFVALVNRTFGLEEKAHADFNDISSGDYFITELQRAKAEGYIKGYGDGSFRPFNKINRQEAATILYRLMRLNTLKNCQREFSDTNEVPLWSRDIINAVVEAGYMRECGGMRFCPTKALTRDEARDIVERTAGTAGTVLTEEEAIQGNALISRGNIRLANKIIQGNLCLGSGIGDGAVELCNVTVMGRTIICGGSEIVIMDSTMGDVVIDKGGGQLLKLTASGMTRTSDVIVLSRAYIRENANPGIAFGNIFLEQGIGEGEEIRLDGAFLSVTVNTPGVRLIMGEHSLLGTLNLNKKTEVLGGGMLGTVNINANADGSTIRQKPGRINVQMGTFLENKAATS